ncbi:aminoimidazole riboside kinase [Halanaerobacter jeridensis]|uniref:Fructokinase n=1 Tax=Halanaerobacter jeridensis TaxID=706427 RepID=A0A938XV29_9FIRM|nr:aminoimidazole riboside kinase [Halanaerobacter jeridensis]MBM7556112.1 fructokinase [Halanaerobacter jeridensis]
MNGVITLGEALIDFTPLDDDNMEFKKSPGGAPANVAVGLSRLGVETTFVGKVGDDVLGNFLAKTLNDNGVNTEEMLLTDEARTAITFVTLDQDGDRSFSFYIDPSADRFLRPEEINIDLFKENKILHFGSISLIDDPARSSTKYAVQMAQKNDILVSYDPNLRMNLWSNAEVAKTRIMSVLDDVDILKISEEELEFITGTMDAEKGAQELAQEYDIPLIYITWGSKGAYYYYQGELEFVESLDVEAVDTTGAGDAFVSGVLYQINHTDQSLAELSSDFLAKTAKLASISGALAVSDKGAMSALPTLDEIEERL